MANQTSRDDGEAKPSRRGFLGHVGRGAVASSVPAALLSDAKAGGADAAAGEGTVKYRTLGKTGLRVSEVGFGGHSWAYPRVPDGKDGYRLVSDDEAVEMIAAGLDMGVNFFDSCTDENESRTPGQALKRLKRRDDAIISIRVSHKTKGVEADKKEIFDWTERRLQLWQTDYVDLCLLCNTANDTEMSGFWDMSYSMEALDKLKQQGKIRYTGFGCHFTPIWFRAAFDKYGDYFDICSMPYNVRHRGAEELLPEAKAKGLGVITIKPFARGSLLKKRDLEGADKGLPRDMMAFVLENEHVDICTCGVHTLAQVKENFSASWTKLTPQGQTRLDQLAATPIRAGEHSWLEEGWLHA